MSGPEVVIIGAGMAGLCCARELASFGIPFEIREASGQVGGRVATDIIDGFRLDRGFQVLLTAYPECRRVLSYESLDLRPFRPGAKVYHQGAFHLFADPWREIGSALPTLFSPLGSLLDKFRVSTLRTRLRALTVEEIFARPEVTMRERLAEVGFSAAIMDRFFRPFFAGVFLEPELRTSSRLFDFVFAMLSEGDIALPAKGMGAIPEQIRASLPPDSIKLHARVESLAQIKASAVVVATDGPEAARLTNAIPTPASKGVWCFYFSADHAPDPEPILLLNGDGYGPVNNACVLSNIAPSYAPPGAVLISATVLETAAIFSESGVREQLAIWFGPEVSRWRLIRPYYIPHAQPEQAPPALAEPSRPVRLAPGLFVCGDHRETASLHGAMHSGRRAALAVRNELGR